MDGPGRYYSFEGENDDEIEERRGEDSAAAISILRE